MSLSRRRILRGLERGLRALGVGCLASYLGIQAHAYLEQAAQSRRLDAQLGEGSATVADPSPARTPTTLPPVEAAAPEPADATRTAPAAPDPDVIGRLEIPQIGLRTMVATGDGERTLM